MLSRPQSRHFCPTVASPLIMMILVAGSMDRISFITAMPVHRRQAVIDDEDFRPGVALRNCSRASSPVIEKNETGMLRRLNSSW